MINTATCMNSPCISVLWKYRHAFPLRRVRSPGKIDSELLLIPDAFVLRYSLRCTKVIAEFSTGQCNSFVRGQWSRGVRDSKDRYNHPVHMTEWNVNGPITGYVISADSSHMFTVVCSQADLSLWPKKGQWSQSAQTTGQDFCPWTVRVCDQWDAWERFHVKVPVKHLSIYCIFAIL